MSKTPLSHFNELQKIWYEKLKQSGFEDIEDPKSRCLKQCHSLYFHCRYDPDIFEIKQQYYIQASTFFHEYDFRWFEGSSLVNLEEREIWKHHMEGLSYRDIAIELHKIGIKTNKDKVNKIVLKLLAIMKDYSRSDGATSSERQIS